MPDADVAVQQQLAALGARLAVPDVPDLAERVTARLVAHEHPATRPAPRWVLAAASVVVAALVAVAAVEPAREAVARWFGIGTVQVRRGELPADIGSQLTLGREVPVADVSDAVPLPVVAPASLGPPRRAFVGAPIAEAVTLVWPTSERLAATPTPGVGLLLTLFGGTVERPMVDKEVGPDTRVVSVRVGSAEGLWITGAPHAFSFFDRGGQVRRDTTRLAGNTLLWSQGGVTFRIESSLDLETMLALAGSLEPLRD